MIAAGVIHRACYLCICVLACVSADDVNDERRRADAKSIDGRPTERHGRHLADVRGFTAHAEAGGDRRLPRLLLRREYLGINVSNDVVWS